MCENKLTNPFTFGVIDLWEFLKTETYQLKGERTGKIVEEKLWEVYSKSQLENDTKIKLVNNKKNVLLILSREVKERLIPKDIQSLIIPRFVEITPSVVMFSSWFIGDAGMSPERDPAFFSDKHPMLLKIMKIFQEIFEYPLKDFFLVIQYPLSTFIKMDKRSKIEEIKRHASLLNNVIPIEKIVLVHSGKRGKQGKIPTISAHYNPALFELAVSLAQTLTFKMPLYFKNGFQPCWLKTSIEEFKKHIAIIDLKNVCERTGHKTAILPDDKIKVWKNKRFPFIAKRFLKIDYETLLWVGAMQAEGTKEKQMEFIASGREMLEIIFSLLDKIFDISTIDPHYDILIGENLHNETHKKLNIRLEDKFTRHVDLNTKGEEKVTQCESDEVKDFFINEVTRLYPVVKNMRFYRLRVDRIGQKSHIRVEINCSGRIAKLVWTLANETFYNLPNFVGEFAVQK